MFLPPLKVRTGLELCSFLGDPPLGDLMQACRRIKRHAKYTNQPLDEDLDSDITSISQMIPGVVQMTKVRCGVVRQWPK
jgi:hypothetical protein